MIDRETFINAYIECALWSSTDDNGEPLDIYSAEDIAPETLEEMRQDCADFIDGNTEDLEASDLSAESAGHDFWLTRNRHGAGFWDRGLEEEISERLTKAAHAYGSCDLMLDEENGRIYSL